MKYWIDRRARELSLRFMYSLDFKSTEDSYDLSEFKDNVSSFWETNPINNYYMLKVMSIKKEEMIVIGCSALKNNKIFLRIINKDKFNLLISTLEDSDKFKGFLRTYNLNERTKTEDSDFYKILRDIFANSKKIITKNIIKNKADEIINGCVKNIKPIDDQIDQSIKNWKFDRINSVDLNILRIAVFEILFSNGIPVPVSIKEAIVLALKYSSDESCGFINGILDTISKRALQ
ncbi:transcription antitermination factor NusB [bacterium]|mgnify:FL=1|jgi:N utilization substance protein B|nr:transcription antitermination factor NusB [bacterium]MBT3850619.1 transcription antitermination factor NusB [bacterium]MBT4434955.1 transcription antitermination factor NusB [bacterium]MDG2445491.1 transcription antitermination factor NusB [Thermodesulfobacteriota bacterium]